MSLRSAFSIQTRFEQQFGDTAEGYVNELSVSFWWQPNIIIVTNYTSNPLFIKRGSRSIPGTTPGSFDYVVPAGETLRFPTNSKEFGVFLPLTPALDDPTITALVIWDVLPER